MNIYYSPEDYGLEVVETFEERPDYDFDMLVIWKDKADHLYIGEDSGCSCPTPFERFNKIDDLSKVENYTQLDEAINNWIGCTYRRDPIDSASNWDTQKTEFLARTIREGWIV